MQQRHSHMFVFEGEEDIFTKAIINFNALQTLWQLWEKKHTQARSTEGICVEWFNSMELIVHQVHITFKQDDILKQANVITYFNTVIPLCNFNTKLIRVQLFKLLYYSSNTLW